MDAVSFAANQLRDERIKYIARLMDEIELQRLEIIVDIVGMEAAWRYEHFITQRLHDNPIKGIIPFAKTGVARVIEKLIRSHHGKGGQAVLINESNLLSGLVEGRSGAMIQGFTNNSLTLNRKKTILFKETHAKIDAEDVYAKSGFRQFHVEKSNFHDAVYARKKSKHHELPAWKRLALKPGSSYNFGYTLFRKTAPNDAKCFYAIMPWEVIHHRYDYQAQDREELSEDLNKELKTSVPTRIKIDLSTFAAYLLWLETNPAKNIRQFIAEKFKLKNIEIVQCFENFQNYKLQGKNLSYMDLSGSTISGDISETNFSFSYLIGTQFVNVTSAYKTLFYQSYGAFISAKKVEFREADFSQANFSYGDFSDASLISCQALGTNWYEAKLQNVKSGQKILQDQATQIHLMREKIINQQKEIQTQNSQILEQNRTLQSIRLELQQKQNAQALPQDELIQMTDQMDQLIRQAEAQQAFQFYCQDELANLKIGIQNAASKEIVAALKLELQGIHTLLNSYKIESLQVSAKTSNERDAALINRFNTAIKINQSEQDKRFKEITLRFTNLYEQMEIRVKQLEEKIDHLEQWAQSAEVSLQELKRDSVNNKSTLNRIEALEIQVKELLAQSKSQKKINADMDEKLQQNSQNLQQLQTKAVVTQSRIQTLADNPIILSIRNELRELKEGLANQQQQEKVHLLYSSLPQQVGAPEEKPPARNVMSAPAEVEPLYQQGRSLEKGGNYSAAYNAYAAAAHQGHTRARTNQAYLLMNPPDGLQKNIPLAFSLLTESAKEGHLRAIMNLAKMLEDGDNSIKKDLPAALEWYEKGAAKKDQHAILKVTELQQKLNPPLRIRR